jgi:hypothetical protein
MHKALPVYQNSFELGAGWVGGLVIEVHRPPAYASAKAIAGADRINGEVALPDGWNPIQQWLRNNSPSSVTLLPLN